MAKALLEGEFIIGDTGEQFIVAQWHPDPKAIEQDLIKMAKQFDNWSVPLQETKQLMIEDTRLHFMQERDPFSRKWVPLEASYADRKQKAVGDKPILQYSGALEKAATSEEAWFVTQDAVVFNADALPKKTNKKSGKVDNYGAAHQTGSGSPGTTGFQRVMRSVPAEKFLDFMENLPEKQRRAFEKYDSLEGSGKNLVQRMFIGATEETITAIEEVFIRFLKRTVEDPWTTLGFEETVEDPWATLGLHFQFVPGRAFGGGQSMKGEPGSQFIGSFKGT